MTQSREEIEAGGQQEEVPQPVPRPRFTSRPAMIEVVYRCQNPKCQAVDRGRYYPNEVVVAYVNCWKCKAGVGKTIEDMVQSGQCMKAFSMGPEDGDQERVTEISKVNQQAHQQPGRPGPGPGQPGPRRVS